LEVVASFSQTCLRSFVSHDHLRKLNSMISWNRC